MEKEKIKTFMDYEFVEAEEALHEHEQKADIDGYWKTWSETVEKAWMAYLRPGKEAEKLITGRGKVNIIEQIPTPKTKTDNEVWNRWYHEAVDKLRQARRCEQMAYRILKYHEEKEDGKKKDKYKQLNKEAWAAFVRKQKEQNEDEKDFVENEQKLPKERHGYDGCASPKKTSDDLPQAPRCMQGKIKGGHE